MQPIEIRLLGATEPDLPRADDGIIRGIVKQAAALAACEKNCRLLDNGLSCIKHLPPYYCCENLPSGRLYLVSIIMQAYMINGIIASRIRIIGHHFLLSGFLLIGRYV